MAAAFFAMPELALDKSEAKAISEAIAEVNRHYKIPGINPGHAAVMSLVFVLVVTYGKRAPVIMASKKKPSNEQPTVMAQSFGKPPEPWFPATASVN